MTVATVSYFRKSATLYGIVALIGLLLMVNVYLIYKNTGTIERHRRSLAEAEQVKVNTVEIIRNLHLLDMALRSYALVRVDQFLEAVDSCIIAKDPLLNQTESALRNQAYPMAPFNKMKDSINAYIEVCLEMRAELLKGNTAQFINVLRKDPGLKAWREFKRFEADVMKFETAVSEESHTNYTRALRRSYLLQAILFLVAMPTLIYTAYYASKAIKLSEQLRQSQEEQFELLREQKVKLERMVDERTQELMSQNEEIAAQNEEIAARNDQLMLQQEEIEKQRNILRDQNAELLEAKYIIEQQHGQIQERHDDLAREVQRQTGDIRQTNLELIEHNSRLEQFAYMISHNLRAPLARFIGLSSILKYSRDATENSSITQMMVNAAHELDHVIKDLGVILGVQKAGSQLVADVNLSALIEKVKNSLFVDIRETGARITADYGKVTTLTSIPQYIESILTNLISNAIKYRQPSRIPEIHLVAREDDDWIYLEVSDNGVGIDLEQSREKIFSLYQRFHFHVEGKGLGLYLVKTQVEALGGRVEVKSQPGQGTTFVLYLRRKGLSGGDAMAPKDP